jgi:hypothetical protein
MPAGHFSIIRISTDYLYWHSAFHRFDCISILTAQSFNGKLNQQKYLPQVLPEQ